MQVTNPMFLLRAVHMPVYGALISFVFNAQCTLKTPYCHPSSCDEEQPTTDILTFVNISLSHIESRSCLFWCGSFFTPDIKSSVSPIYILWVQLLKCHTIISIFCSCVSSFCLGNTHIHRGKWSKAETEMPFLGKTLLSNTISYSLD